MAGFKPKNSGKGNSGGDTFERGPQPVPKNQGARKARVSLIVDLGIQKREDFEDPVSKETRPQKPCQQVVVFADLVQDIVDYGGTIGKAQYRLMLNKSFAGLVQGVNFAAVPPKDAKGNLIAGKPWGLHPANLLTKLAKATGKTEIIPDEGPHGMDISLLLDQPFIADIEVTEKDAGKADKDGNPIIYRNVNFKGASKIGMRGTGEFDEEGSEIEVEDTVAPLKQPARCITFDDATVEDIKFIRANLIKIIKLAENYAGSQMQKAIEEFEAGKGSNSSSDAGSDDAGDDAPAEKPTPVKKTTAKKTAKAPVDNSSDMDDDIPF